MTTLSIINALVFDGVSGDLAEGPVHVADGRIVSVGGAAQRADRVIDAAGGTIIPGLIDAHCHAFGIDMNALVVESRPLSYLALAAARRLKSSLLRGFTTIRDPSGGEPGLARAIAEGLLPSPRFLWTGAGLSQTGGHGDVREPDSFVCGCSNHMTEVVDGVDPLKKAVRERFRQGAHAIKIMASGGVTSPGDNFRIPQYSPEEIQAVTSEAARRGSYVIAHAYSPEAIRHAVDNGVRCVEHGNLLDEETAAFMNSKGAALVPTLAIYDAMSREEGFPAEVRQKMRDVFVAGQRAVELAEAAGVRVGFGTDLMGDQEVEQLIGLRHQIEVQGVIGTLRSATSTNAQIMGLADLGQVKEGFIADLVVLPGNPTSDPSILWAKGGRTVIQAGTVI